jgi:uncharacterized protein YkwD
MKNSILLWILAVIWFIPTKLYSQQRADDNFKQEFLQHINSVRAKGCKCGVTYMPPVAPLTWNDVLEEAALAHARDMGEHNYFSHNGRNGSSPNDRAIKAGYGLKGFRSYTTGENIAMGQQSIAEVSNGWFKSEGHCMNLMNASFKEIGIAEYDTYWVEDFGGREAFSPEQQRLIKSGQMKIIQRPVTAN